MSADIPASDSDSIEVVGRSDGISDADLWGDVPPEQRLDWLRVASRNWPFHPGAAVGGMTVQTLSEGHLVHSKSLIHVARNAFDAGFTPAEYDTLRKLLRGRVPSHIVEARDPRPEYADRYMEIDAHRCRGWLDRVRGGVSPEVAMDTFLGELATTSDDPRTTSDTAPNSVRIGNSRSIEFGSGDSSGGGWGIPLGGRGWLRGWWRVFEVYPPRRSVARTGTGKYAHPDDGAVWEAELETIARELTAVGFTPQDLYILSLTLERLDDDQWARVDKRLFDGEGVHTRHRWMLAPIPEKWVDWPRLVHQKGKLPHEATEIVLGGVWRNQGWL